MSAWTAVKTFTSTILTAADMNTYVSDNTNYLKDLIDIAPRMLDRKTSTTTFTTSSAENTMYSYSVPGGTLSTTKILHLSATGSYVNNSGGAITFTVKVKYGATTIFSAIYTNVGNGNTTQPILIDTEIAASGATNTQVSKTIVHFDGCSETQNVGAAIGKDFVGGAGGGQLLGGGIVSYCTHTTMTEDSTAAKALAITFTSSSASASVTETMSVAHTEVK